MASLLSAEILDEYADELDCVNPPTSNGAGLIYLQGLRDKAMTLINNGEVNTFINTTVNGQTFGSQVEVSAADMFSIVQSAIRIHQGRSVKITYPIFSNIPH